MFTTLKNLCHKRFGQTERFKIAQDYTFSDSNFTMNGLILKQLGTNVLLDETKCNMEESDQNHKKCGQTNRSEVIVGQSLALIGGF